MKMILLVAGAGLAFLLTIISGIWLTHSGKPLPALLFNVHKILAVAATVLTVILVYSLFKIYQADMAKVIWTVVAGLSVLGLFVSGALLIFEKTSSKPVLILHSLLPVLTVISLTAILLLTVFRKQ